ncbi:Carbohydrate binding domain-containing protein [Rathayibacter oskolensis]|uniref:Carbohydrate binding domain-containing protein n=1 Tax=Rathayibacter oskolensis TaxID=1891671 RepID=A0A1X7P108_9MICO|nr:family 43 glycosylhydrolase [Rathayibacter oskolensis]SMH43407.1 Carbohydrate binding domain-containing protein [Rathayibacter oskolensis]
MSAATRAPGMRALAVTAIGALVAAGLLATAVPARAAEEWSPRSFLTSTDRGDGTYSVPLLNADVPDVSVERVPAAENDEGRDLYYMISTTMHLSPGAPIMKSYDLVNWEIVNHVFDRLEIGDRFSLRNGQNSYGNGQWASSLRYHDGRYYVAFNTNNLGGSYLYSTDDIENGAWTRVALGRAFHDPSLFFDEADGGTPYIFYGSGSTSAVQLSDDLTTVVAEFPNILRTSDYPGASWIGGLFEGAQVQYIDGNYYIVIITWPSGQGRQVALFRSEELLGRYATADGSNPYEGRGVLNSNGFAQGSLVPISREDGTTDWHGMFFRDSFPTGRIPGLVPATWTDGWPTFGTNGSVPVNGTFPKPITLSPEEELFERQKSLVVSDDFENDAPAKAYTDEEWTLPTAPDIDESLLGVELIQNPGAESGTAPWAGQFGATLTRDTGDAASGTAALRVGSRTLNGSGPSQVLANRLQRGVTYTVSAKVKYTSGPASVRFNLCADFGAGPQTMAFATVPQGQWTTITGTYTVPPTANVGSAKFAVETPWGNPQPASSSVEYLLDDVSMIGAQPTTELPSEAEIAPNGSRLDLAWQWNHAPDNRYWSLTDREGWLRLTNGKVVTGQYVHSKLSTSPELTWLEEARNTLSQRIVAPKQSAEAELDVSGMKDGDVAGLAAYNRGFSYVAVKRVDGVSTVGVVDRGQPFATTIDQAAVEAFLPGTTAVLPDSAEVHLKADLELNAPSGQLWTTFHYSLDGRTWTKLGTRVGPQTLDGSLTHFMGHRIGLFSYATESTGGHVDVDSFLLSDTLTSEGKALDRSQLEAAIAHAATLREADYPADAWADLESALAKAEAVGTVGTQNQLDAPERALSYQLARLGTLKAEAPALAVAAEATTRCIGGKVFVTVKATNGSDVPVTVDMTGAFGTKTIAAVAPGRNASHAFTTRAVAVPAGEVAVTASAPVDGAPVSSTVPAGYPATSCG